jgi:protein-disulfide isomerase
MTHAEPASQLSPVGPGDHILGFDDAPVTLLEYGDFECPQCGSAYPIVKELKEHFGDRLRLVFRNFPLTNVHPHAQRAAEAAEWAASFEAFWPMHDVLFENQTRLKDRQLLDYAQGLGLTPSSLADAWNAHTYFSRVKEHFLGGIRAGVKGTPTFFINGVLHQGAWDAVSLGRALRDAMPVNDRAGAPRDPGLPAPGAEPPR